LSGFGYGHKCFLLMIINIAHSTNSVQN
jgi:hypothetical protein